jgi:flagellar hook-associated protein 1 FlgK
MNATEDPTLENHLRVEVQMGSAPPVNVTALIREGEMGANLDLRDNVLSGYQRRLDQLAAGIVSNVNLLHRAGFALDGVTTGIDFFQGAIANGANGLPPTVLPGNFYAGMVNAWSVNAAVVTNPSLIAAADAAGAPGNNSNARAIANLQTQVNTVDTDGNGVGDAGSFSTYVGSLVNTIGTDAQGYRVQSTNYDNLINALQMQRDRISGVDLDEEAANLMAYQRGYQAAARYVNVLNQLTDQLVNQFGR